MTSRDWADALSVRIYQSVVTDEKFVGVYDDDRNWAWYVRLLLQAKAVYPAPAFLPAALPRSVKKALIEKGVLLVTNGHYTVSGLAKEMSEAPDPQRAGGVVRAALAERDGGGRFIAGGAPPPQLDPDDDGRADIEAYLEVRRRLPTPRQRQVLDDVLARHDVNGPKWAADIIVANPSDPIGAVIEADKKWRDGRKQAAVTEERESAERHRRKPGLRDPLLQDIARSMAERYETEVPA